MTALDVLGNLASRCPACHSRKTARRDGGFGRAPSRWVGLDGNGMPKG